MLMSCGVNFAELKYLLFKGMQRTAPVYVEDILVDSGSFQLYHVYGRVVVSGTFPVFTLINILT